MSSETTMVATQFRLQEWAAQIRECQNRRKRFITNRIEYSGLRDPGVRAFGNRDSGV